MITGSSMINDLDELKKYLESEILELEVAIYDVQEGDEIDPNYFIELSAKKEVLEQLLKRIV